MCTDEYIRDQPTQLHGNLCVYALLLVMVRATNQLHKYHKIPSHAMRSDIKQKGLCQNNIAVYNSLFLVSAA